MTEERFNEIKKFTDLNLKNSLIQDQFGVAPGTVWRVRNADNFKAYQKKRREENQRRVAPKNSQEAKPQKTASVETASQEPANVQGVYERLDRIAVAMERLADAWESQPARKKGLFK